MDSITAFVQGIILPKMAPCRQTFLRPIIEDIPAEVHRQLARDKICRNIRPGMRIAVTAGSRGISNIALILRETVRFLRGQGAQPFLIPAMGSHGGATAQGQLELLREYGITEEYCGCEILSDMSTVQIGVTSEGHPVHVDRNAQMADGIVVVNRIKSHSSFRGTYESGLTKMLTIGLGKQKGASICHEAGFQDIARLLPMFAQVILDKLNVVCGLGILENAYEETCQLIALNADEILPEEPALLKRAASLMPKILFPDSDVLIVDEIGKNFSGDGMDPNVTGTFATPYASGGHQAKRVVVLDLSAQSHGNAIGVGMADFTTRRLFSRFDMDKTYANALTSTVVSVAKIPPVAENDRSAIQAAIAVCNGIDRSAPRLVRIHNTGHLENICISEGLLPQAAQIPGLEVLGPAQEMSFDRYGNLL